MPLYEYECDVNGHRFEVIQKFSDPPVETCPKCGSPVRKLMSSPAIQFKGSGWYITDYAKKDSVGARDSRDSKETKESKGETKTEGKADAAGDGKAAAKSDTAPAKSESKSDSKASTS